MSAQCPSCGSHETLASIIGLGEEIEVAFNHSSGALTKHEASSRLKQIQEETFELIASRLGGSKGNLLMLKQILAGGVLKNQDICANCGIVFYPNIVKLREQAEHFRDEMRKKHPLDSILIETDREEPPS